MAIDLQIDDRVATLTVNRPSRLNALDTGTLEELGEAIRTAEEDAVRCLVLRGAGEEAFIAGADIAELQDMSVSEAQRYADLGQEVTRSLETFPGPTIASIGGYAFGGGLELALACDLRVAAEGSLMGQTELDIGLMPGWGATQRLPPLVGDELARRLIYFSERVDATDALEYGLVGEVVAASELDEAVAQMAATLADRPRHALRASKEALNIAAAGERTAGLRYEGRAWASLFGTADQSEGMAAFVEDREPDFE